MEDAADDSALPPERIFLLVVGPLIFVGTGLFLLRHICSAGAAGTPVVVEIGAQREATGRVRGLLHLYDQEQLAIVAELQALTHQLAQERRHAAATSGVSTTVGRTVLTRILCLPSSSAWMRMMWSRLALVDE